MAPTYAVPRLLARNGLTLQDFDFYEIHEAFASVVLATLAAWESEEYCKERLGLDAALGVDRSNQAQRQRLLAGGRSPVRRDRWADRRAAGQATGREEEADGSAGPRPDLDLRGRRAGRHGDSGGLNPGRSHTVKTFEKFVLKVCNGCSGGVDTTGSSVLPSDPPTRRQHGAIFQISAEFPLALRGARGVRSTLRRVRERQIRRVGLGVKNRRREMN